ncbi:MAG: acyl-CoA dehydrogenase family protein [Sandaracinus sp.]|nr:acyl-CoA dehydrogenase family protein [Sandaracinus sp.]
MDLRLPELHASILDTVRRFAASELSPRAHALEEGEGVAQANAAFDALDLWGLTLPEERGGAGLDALAYALVVEALAGGSPSLAWRFAVHAGPASAALSSSSLDLTAACNGKLASFVAADSRLAPRAQSHWVLESGEILAADALAAEAITPLGLRGADLVRVEARDTVGADPSLRHWYELGAAALMVGAAAAAVETARVYALDRRQFGAPIASLQAIQFKLADGLTELDAARLLVRRAATEGRGAGAARMLAGRAATRAASEALQIHGGYGYTREYPVERQLRAIRMLAKADAARTSVAADALR